MENTENSISEQSLKDENLRSKIRTRIIKGWNITTICEDLDINESTWYTNIWRNTSNFADFVQNCEKMYFLKQAEAVSREILSLDATDNAKMLQIKQKEAEFIRETQGKDLGYTKRSEVIGLNVNKTEPLDADQKAKLDKLLGKTLPKDNNSVAIDVTS